jgi:hypothetical protein
MASPDWAPRIGAYINAAHWMVHSLQEAAGPLLLLDLEGVAHAWHGINATDTLRRELVRYGTMGGAFQPESNYMSSSTRSFGLWRC